MIPITKPFLPPQDEYHNMLTGIWDRNYLTNDGPLVRDLEYRLRSFLKSNELHYTSNGTIALQLAIKVLGITKKIVTTPFSYVATTSSIVWEGCEPVFADIDPETLNIDPQQIEKVLDSETEAILATHCFGNPCDIDEIDKIAKKHGLKVIYDAAHCFGSTYRGKSVFDFGDLSTTSFHATKLFHTIEGGAVFSSDQNLLKRIALLRNFGHAGMENFEGVGINGKNSEFHAAMGLLNLNYIETILDNRKLQCELYDQFLQDLDVDRPRVLNEAETNFSYYPILFKNERINLSMKKALENSDIFPRRYFNPSLSTLNYIESEVTPVSDDVSSRILCLPLFHDISRDDQELVAKILLETQKTI